jgi:hypothetical protein
MGFIFQHTWILFIVVMCINGIILWMRAQSYIAQAPALKAGYVSLIKGWLFWGNLPWVVMGIGDLTGMTNGTQDYFHPRSLNPMVLAFDLVVVLIWVLGSNWIYFRGGADFLVKHPGFVVFNAPGVRKDISSPRIIQLIWTLCLAGGVISMIMMWLQDGPASPLP